MFRSIAAFGLSTFILCSIAACEAAEELDNTLTCSDVCTRYKDCVNESYDVEACTNKCENDASSSEEKEAKLEICDNCIEDRSCAGAIFACGTECAGFVP